MGNLLTIIVRFFSHAGDAIPRLEAPDRRAAFLDSLNAVRQNSKVSASAAQWIAVFGAVEGSVLWLSFDVIQGLALADGWIEPFAACVEREIADWDGVVERARRTLLIDNHYLIMEIDFSPSGATLGTVSSLKPHLWQR